MLGIEPIIPTADGFSWSVLGQFAGIVATVVLFLRYLVTKDEKIKDITNVANDQVKAIMASSQDHIKEVVAGTQDYVDRLSKEYLAQTGAQHEQLRALVSDHLNRSQEQVKALGDMRAEIVQKLAEINTRLDSKPRRGGS